jgi:hypothetical protein
VTGGNMPEEKQKYPFEVSACVLSGIILFFGLVIFFGIVLVSMKDKTDKLELRIDQLSDKLAQYEGLTEPHITNKALTIRGVTYIAVDK